MNEDSISTIIASVAAIIAVLVPAVVQYARSKGLQIKNSEESFIQSAIQESAQYAEEYARRKPASGQEKLDLATRYAEALLKSYGIKRVTLPLGDRIEAALVTLPGRAPKMVSFPPTQPKAKK